MKKVIYLVFHRRQIRRQRKVKGWSYVGRRGENIYKRKDGRWEGRYPKGRKASGLLHYGYVYGKTYQEVKNKVTLLRAEFQQVCQEYGTYAGSFSQWVTSWLEEDVQFRVKLSTLASYRYKYKHYILPKLGHRPLNQLKNQEIQDLIYEWQEASLSASTIHLLVQLMRSTLESACKAGFIFGNPCTGLHLPKRQKQPVQAMTKQDQRKLEAVAKEDTLGLPTLLALHTGLRIGEIAALKWEDVNFSEETISVRHTYQRIPLKNQQQKTRLVYSQTKTFSSMRIVPFSKQVKNWLQDWREKCSGSFLFEKLGRPLEPRTLTNHFHRLLKKAGLNRFCFHQLRHTFATRCMEAKSHVAAISALLGHASAKMTLDIYTDGLTEQRREVIDAMEGLNLS